MKTLLAATSAALVIAFASPAFAGAGCSKSTRYRPVAKVATPAPVATPAAAPGATTSGAKDLGQTQGTTASEQPSSVSFSHAQGGLPSKI